MTTGTPNDLNKGQLSEQEVLYNIATVERLREEGADGLSTLLSLSGMWATRFVTPVFSDVVKLGLAGVIRDILCDRFDYEPPRPGQDMAGLGTWVPGLKHPATDAVVLAFIGPNPPPLVVDTLKMMVERDPPMINVISAPVARRLTELGIKVPEDALLL
jgi:hypothetical protein